MNHTLLEGDSANIAHNILDSGHYKQNGGNQKFSFMAQITMLWEYNIPSNKPFIYLIHNLHLKLHERYLQVDDAIVKGLLLAAPQLPSFVTNEEYNNSTFRHEALMSS
jgi:hypothetical protein